MKYQLENKVIEIPDEEIKVSMKNLDLTENEAIQMWLEDEGYEVNEEQVALGKKVAESGIMRGIHGTGGGPQKNKAKRERKPDEVKDGLVEGLKGWLEEQEYENVQIVKTGKLITFEIDGVTFKLDLIRQRPPKK